RSVVVESFRTLRGRSIHAYDALTYMYDCPVQGAHPTYKFTGKERDAESGLDNFGKRYDSSSMGRFMTPDPLMASAKVWDPADLESLRVCPEQPSQVCRSHWDE